MTMDKIALRAALAFAAALVCAPQAAAADEVASVGLVMTVSDSLLQQGVGGCEFQGTGSCTFVCLPGFITAEAKGAGDVSANASCGGTPVASCSGAKHCYGEGLYTGTATNGLCTGTGSDFVRCYSGTPGGVYLPAAELGGVNGSCDGFEDGAGVGPNGLYLPNGEAISAIQGIPDGCGENGHIEAHVGED